jgi:hypothetical protein
MRDGKGKDVINLGDVPGGSRNPPTTSACWPVPSAEAMLPNVGTVPTVVLAGSFSRAAPLKATMMGPLKGDFFASCVNSIICISPQLACMKTKC